MQSIFVYNYVILSTVDSYACIEILRMKLSFVNLTKLKFCIAYSFCPWVAFFQHMLANILLVILTNIYWPVADK